MTWLPDGVLIGVLLIAPWVAFFDLLLHGGWVSDDIQGIATYHGTLTKPVPVDHITLKVEAPKRKYDLSWGNLFTWTRWHLGKVYNPASKKDPKQPQYVASPFKHHRNSNVLASATALLAWAFLSRQVGEWPAFLAVVLWMVHPLNAQVTGWISGIGYLTAAFFMFAGLNWAQWTLDHGWLASPLGTLGAVGIYGLFQTLAGRCQFTSCAVTLVLAWLGWWPFLVPAALGALYEAAQTLHFAVVPRVRTFRAQKMGASTYLNFRKLIVVCKSWYYYLRLALWPKRLGLYHVFGYHYPLPETETEDRYFWWGALLLAAWGAALYVAPPAYRLGLLWYPVFLAVVLNWITIHQFVTERYVWIPVLGVCLLVAQLLPLWAWCLLAGLALARTWAHLPTYYNEVQFYQSNLWNFPTSEVAAGNLGVAYLRGGLGGSALDAWQIGTRMNPDYDVNWYNLFSTFRNQGMYDQARQCLVRAVSSPTCHFPEQWATELHRFDAELDFMRSALQVPEKERLVWMETQLLRAISLPGVQYPELWKDLLGRTRATMDQQRPGTTPVPPVQITLPPAPPPPVPPPPHPPGTVMEATTR